MDQLLKIWLSQIAYTSNPEAIFLCEFSRVNENSVRGEELIVFVEIPFGVFWLDEGGDDAALDFVWDVELEAESRELWNQELLVGRVEFVTTGDSALLQELRKRFVQSNNHVSGRSETELAVCLVIIYYSIFVIGFTSIA